MKIDEANRRLQRKLNKMYSKNEQKNLFFWPDKITEKDVTWFFEEPTQKIELVCSLRTGIITTCGQGI